MTRVDDVSEKLVRVLLAAAAEMLGEDSEAALDLGRSVVREIHAQGTCNLLLEYTERTRRRRITERGVLKTEAEIGERRSVGEALKDAVEVARVAEVFEP